MPNNLLPYEHNGTCCICELKATKRKDEPTETQRN